MQLSLMFHPLSFMYTWPESIMIKLLVSLTFLQAKVVHIVCLHDLPSTIYTINHGHLEERHSTSNTVQEIYS